MDAAPAKTQASRFGNLRVLGSVRRNFAGLSRTSSYCTTEGEKARHCFRARSHKEHELPKSHWRCRPAGARMRPPRLLLGTGTERGTGARLGFRAGLGLGERP